MQSEPCADFHFAVGLFPFGFSDYDFAMAVHLSVTPALLGSLQQGHASEMFEEETQLP